MAKAKKLPSGNWRVQVYAGEVFEDGVYKKKYKSITESTEAKANYAAELYLRHRQQIAKDPGSMTLAEAVDAYIESKSNLLSPTTIDGYYKSKRRLASLLPLALNRITERQIDLWINTAAKEYSAKTISNDWGLLRAVLKKYRKGFDYTPVLPEVYPTVTAVPMDEELALLYAQIKDTPLEIPFLLAAWLGMRVSEIRGLRWDHVFEDHIIIDQALVTTSKGHVLKAPKERSSKRILPLPQELKAILDAAPRTGEYVTTMTGQTIYKLFTRACAAAGLPRYRFHDLRHTNATIMLEENVPDKYIAARGGWGSEIYKQRYQHTTTGTNAAISSILDARFRKIFSEDQSETE